MFNDLSKLQDVISEMGQIVVMEIPFSKMSDLANLVFKAGEIKQAILSEKYENTKRKLEKDLSKINQEMQEALSQDLVEEKKKQIQERGEALAHGYEDWFNSLSPMSQNMDSYITSSESAVKKYREFIAQMLVSTADVEANFIAREERKEMYQKLKQAISSLKPVQREIIKMIYVEGKSQKEVAKELGIAESTLSGRVKLIISKLKENIL